MKDFPIGIFDSGFGGLSAVREIQKILPHEDIVYFGDTARVPYGTRSRETLIKYAHQDVSFLLRKNVKAIVIACGTVSSVAYATLKREMSLPMVGVVEPAAAEAVSLTKNGIIGIMGTGATVKSGSFKAELERIGKASGKKIESAAIACPLLVALVENGYIGNSCEITRLAVREYLAPIKSSGADTLILGCTHFPLIKDIISDEWKRETGSIINSSRQAAYRIKEELISRDLLSPRSQRGRTTVYSSDDMETFSSQAKLFLAPPPNEEKDASDIEYCPLKIEIEDFQ